jgi:hypothetical protein
LRRRVDRAIQHARKMLLHLLGMSGEFPDSRVFRGVPVEWLFDDFCSDSIRGRCISRWRRFP